MRLADLEEAINEKRDEMIRIGMAKGLSNEETIYCSQELDKLLNDYDNLLTKYDNTKSLDIYDAFFDFIHKHIFKMVWLPYSFKGVNKNNRLH